MTKGSLVRQHFQKLFKILPGIILVPLNGIDTIFTLKSITEYFMGNCINMIIIFFSYKLCSFDNLTRCKLYSDKR